MPDGFENKRVPYFGDFVVFDPIGQGGTGVVYDAQQASLDRPVALKILRSDFAATETGIRRFRAEAEAVARLNHPNIVPIYEIGEHEGQPYLAMELVQGESLADRIARLGSKLEETDAAILTVKVARTVHHAHQRGVLHRDLKPGNIIIDDSGEPHLIDFGLAKCLEKETGITQTGSFLGTPAFASPEQAAGRNSLVTTASDVYGLGAILYALLTGKPPFVGESAAETIEKVQNSNPLPPRAIRPAASRDLEIICLKCLEKEPARRYASALDLAEDIERYLDGRPITARPVGVFERFWMWSRRNPVHAGLGIATSLVVVASLVAIFLWLNVRSQAHENDSLLKLGSTISVSRTRNPRKMSWSEDIRRSLTPDRVVTQKPYYRDQIAATLEGLDAILIARRSLFLNEQVFFEQGDNMLFLAGATNTESWLIHSETNFNSTNSAGYPGKPIAFPKGAPLQVLRSPSGKLGVWQASQGRILCDLELPSGLSVPEGEDGILSATSSDGNLLGLVLKDSKEGDVMVFWKLPSGEMVRTVIVGSSATALDVSADGAVAACGNLAGQVRVWEVSNGKQIEQLSLSTLPVRSLAFAPNVWQSARQENEQPGWLLASGDEGGSIGIWNLADHRVQAVCRGGHYQVFCLAFNPDGMTLASGGRGPVRLWDTVNGTPLLDLGGDYCGALAFSPDGSRLAASTDHHLPVRQVNVWELQNGRGIATLRGLSSSATKVVFSPQSDRLAAVGIGWEVGVWDLKNKKLLRLLESPRGFTADNFALAFNPDGRLLAISTGEEAQLWDVSTGRLLRSWKLPPGIADGISFPEDNALFLLRMETLQGTEMPLSNAAWQKYPRVCRLRNLLASEPLKPITEIKDFNVGVFGIWASSNGRFFAVEGIGSTNGTFSRRIQAVNSSTGEVAWQTGSTNPVAWAKIVFTSSGSQFAFTTSGKEYRMKDLLETNGDFRAFPFPPAAIGPECTLWAARSDESGAERGVSLFEGDKPRVNLGLDSEILIAPCFDHTGRWLAWGNADGTVSLCNLKEVHAELGRSSLAW